MTLIALMIAASLAGHVEPRFDFDAWTAPQSAAAYERARRCHVRPLEQGSGNVTVCPGGVL